MDILGDVLYGAAGVFTGIALGAATDAIFTVPATKESQANTLISLGVHGAVDAFLLANSGRIMQVAGLERPGIYPLYLFSFMLSQRRFGMRLYKVSGMVESAADGIFGGVRDAVKDIL